MAYQKILAALDRSELGEQVFERALAIAKINNAALKLFHSLPIEGELSPYAALYHEDLAGVSAIVQQNLTKEAEEVRNWLHGLSQRAIAEGITPEWDWKVGDPARWIRDIADSWDADLVVLGRRGLSGLSEVFLGSVSNYIVHHVRCSVLIVQSDVSQTSA
jgi:nucleotide-binding universal stress UspA family protein